MRLVLVLSRIVAIASVFFLPSAMPAQNISREILPLLKVALQKSRTLQNQQSEISRIHIETRQIRQRYIPKIEANALYNYFSINRQSSKNDLQLRSPSITLPQFFIPALQNFDIDGALLNVGLTARMMIFSGLQIPYAAKAMEEKAKVQEFLLEKDRTDVIIEVFSAFDQLALIKHYKSALQEGQLRLEKEKKRVDRAIQAGLAIPYEGQKIELAQLELESRFLEYSLKKSLLYDKISLLTGISHEMLDTFILTLKPWQMSKPFGEIHHRPELKALVAALRAHDFKIKMNKYSFLPKLQLFGSLSYLQLHSVNFRTSFRGIEKDLTLDQQWQPFWMIGLAMKWELFDGLHRKHEKEKILLERNITENQKEEALEKLELLAKKARGDLELSEKQIKLRERKSELARKALDIADKSFQQGLISVIERLESESAFEQSQLDYFRAIVDQRRAAMELYKAHGILNMDTLINADL